MDESLETTAPDAPEQTDQPVAEDTTAPPSTGEEISAPEVEPDAQPFDDKFDPSTLPPELQDRYRQMHGDYTKKTQSLAEQRKEFEQAAQAAETLKRLQTDPEAQLAALRELAELHGYTLDDDNDEPEDTEPDDPVEALRQKLDAMEAEKATEREQQAQEQQLHAIDTHVTEQIKAFGESQARQIPEDEESIIVSHAVSAFPPGNNGLPQIDQAIKAYESVINREVERRIEAYRQSKQAPAPGSGQPGTTKEDLNDPEVRIRRMAAMMEAGD